MLVDGVAGVRLRAPDLHGSVRRQAVKEDRGLGGLETTGGVETRRQWCSPEAGPGEIPGEVRVVRGYKGLGRLPGTTANLLRGLWELAVQRSGVLTAEQRRGEAERRGGGG